MIDNNLKHPDVIDGFNAELLSLLSSDHLSSPNSFLFFYVLFRDGIPLSYYTNETTFLKSLNFWRNRNNDHSYTGRSYSFSYFFKEY